jgi:hypothetical protein
MAWCSGFGLFAECVHTRARTLLPPPLPLSCTAACPARSKCKLYRYEAHSNEWKERGLGVVKLLKHKANQKIRLLMRQEKTLKIRANHIGAWRVCWGVLGCAGVCWGVLGCAGVCWRVLRLHGSSAC